MAFAGADQLRRAYQRLQTQFPESEFVIVSTCNRVEIYAAGGATAAMPNFAQIAQFLSEFHQVPQDDFVGELRELNGTPAVTHLFEVVSSLDSMVLGEPQIVNQIKEAYRLAEENQSCGPFTHALFQGAIRTSARVRTETRLAEGRVSIASVAVGEFGKSIFDHFGDKQVLIVGAGEMAEETLRYLQDEGVQQIIVANRNFDRAQRLAEERSGLAIPWQELDVWMRQADVIVSTTGSDRPIIDVARFRKARRGISGRPVFILDLGAPRDFDPAVGDLEDVFLYDIDSLQQTCEENRKARGREIEQAARIIEAESARLMAEFYRRAGGDVVTRLREGWHDIAQQELERLFKKSSHFDEQDREAVERTVERIVNKLLHPPLEALKDESQDGSPHGLINALKRLFGL
ncbi:MAG: glutamyl-tRNA reductase [Planctomycetaceae bacterium]